MLLNWGRHHARRAASGEPDTAGGCRRAYPGWRMVWALAVTETISYGVLYYSFAAFLLPMQHSLGFSQATLTGAFSLSVLLTGAGAVPAGAWLDCCGARGLMTAVSLLGAGCVLLWARVGDLAGLYLAFAGIGLGGAAVQYEPAFATINAWFDTQRQKALLTITMVAGLASTIFLPASALLISRLGWRQALLILAAVQVVTAMPHVLLLRRRPSDHGWQRDGVRDPSGSAAAPPARRAPARVWPDVTEGRELSATLRSGPVALLTASAVLGSVAIAAVAVLFLTYLRQGGYTLAAASAAVGALGFVQIGGGRAAAGQRPGRARRYRAVPGRLRGQATMSRDGRQARCQAPDAIGQLGQCRVEAARVARRYRVRDGPVHRQGLGELLVGQVAYRDHEVALAPDLADVPGPHPGQRQVAA